MNDLKTYLRNGHDHWLRDLLMLTFALGIPFLQFLGGLPLIDPDEGRYAEIPREMLERGDFITPTLNYVKYFEKPPLLYWLNALSIHLFGQNEFAARLPSALCGLATILATYIIARRLYDRRTALFSALILGTSAGFVLQSRIILTDMLLTLCLTCAMGAFIIAANDHRRRDNSGPWYAFYLFCALAVLAKGLIGIVFPGGIIFFYLLFTGTWRTLTRARLVVGLALFLLITVPWFVAVSQRNPEFARFFFIHEHFERFTSTVHGRHKPFWFFLPVLAITMLPWSFYIPGAIYRTWRDRKHEEGHSAFYLFIWAALIFLFFSKSGSKLVPYILPTFPPLAILIANRLALLGEEQERNIKTPSFLLGIMFCGITAVAFIYGNLAEIIVLVTRLFPDLSSALNSFLIHAPHLSLAACASIGILTAIQALFCLRNIGGTPHWRFAVLAVSSYLIIIVAARLIMPDITAGESTRSLAEAVIKNSTPDTRIVTWGPMQGLNWYTGKRTATFFNFDELDFGSKQDDQSGWFYTFEDLPKAWTSDKHLLLITGKDTFGFLQLKHPLQNPKIVGTSGKYLLISNK